MSLQWTIVAGYLYFEVAIVIIMMLPLFSARKWHQFFKSRIFFAFQRNASMFFYVLLGVLFLFLADSMREMRKYSHRDTSHVHLASEMKGNVKLFRAQRNFYITGFAIFLSFVIRRLITMLIIQDELTLKAERIIKEAESTVILAKSTVMAGKIYSEDNKDVMMLLKKMESRLQAEKDKSKELKEEATKWRLKYEEISMQLNENHDE